MVLGEMDFAREKPKASLTRDVSLQPAAAAYCPEGSPSPPLPRWTTSTRPGAHRALGMGDGGCRMERANGRIGCFHTETPIPKLPSLSRRHPVVRPSLPLGLR